MSKPIRIAIVGVGNCASSLVQGIHYYSDQSCGNVPGIMHWDACGYFPGDIRVVAAFDIDRRKVGKDVSEAIFAKPNCTRVFAENLPKSNVVVSMSPVLDGFAQHMRDYPDDRTFLLSDEIEPEKWKVVDTLRSANVEILVNYLPVGSERATAFYAECCLEAGVAFLNNVPVFIASKKSWAERFRDRNIPLLGDDIKAQVGATIVHRSLLELFRNRGVEVNRTYQLNTGGNTDFLNMLDRSRLSSKKVSKTEAVQSASGDKLDWADIHVGPSDYVPWQNDNKVCFLRIEGKMFGGVEMNLELRLSVEDSPNSAGVAIDAIRFLKIAMDNKVGGVLEGPASFLFKRPPTQMDEPLALKATEAFLRQYSK